MCHWVLCTDRRRKTGWRHLSPPTDAKLSVYPGQLSSSGTDVPLTQPWTSRVLLRRYQAIGGGAERGQASPSLYYVGYRSPSSSALQQTARLFDPRPLNNSWRHLAHPPTSSARSRRQTLLVCPRVCSLYVCACPYMCAFGEREVGVFV